MEENKVLDCFPRYSERVRAPSFSENRLPAPQTWLQKAQKQKIQANFTQEGTLNASRWSKDSKKWGFQRAQSSSLGPHEDLTYTI
jgi:hypothetical protein